MQLRQGPYRKPFRIHGLGDLADVPHDLGIALEIVNELRVRRAKQPFARGTEPRFSRRPSLLRAFIAGQQRFKIRAFELAPSVDYEDLRKPAESPDTFAQGHHAGTVARWIERQMECERAAGERVSEQCQPWPSQHVA